MTILSLGVVVTVSGIRLMRQRLLRIGPIQRDSSSSWVSEGRPISQLLPVWEYCNIVHPSKIQLKLKSRNISFGHHWFLCYEYNIRAYVIYISLFRVQLHDRYYPHVPMLLAIILQSLFTHINTFLRQNDNSCVRMHALCINYYIYHIPRDFIITRSIFSELLTHGDVYFNIFKQTHTL